MSGTARSPGRESGQPAARDAAFAADARPPRVGRTDYEAIAAWIRPGATVLDLGCGDGALLKHLRETRQVRGYGIEIEDDKVIACVAAGVSVIQGDLERGLADFDTSSFDYVILSLTLQSVRNTEGIMLEMLRVGRQGIVTFPNFGYWRHRLQIFGGRMPVTVNLPYQWYNTPNVHLCTIRDFEEFCRQRSIRILQRLVLNEGTPVSALPNLLGSLAVYRFARAGL